MRVNGGQQLRNTWKLAPPLCNSDADHSAVSRDAIYMESQTRSMRRYSVLCAIEHACLERGCLEESFIRDCASVAA